MELSSVLRRIISRKEEDVKRRQVERPLAQLRETITKSDRDFVAALHRPSLSLIAELKRCSPSRGLIRPDFDAQSIALIYEKQAQAISVLCDDPFFGGSLLYLSQVRPITTIPLLCKDFILSDYQLWEARAYGADAVLLLASLLDPATIETYLSIARQLGMEGLVEVHSEAELDGVLTTSARIIGINNRDLHTLQIDEERVFLLAPRIREECRDSLIVAESGYHLPEQIARLRGIADAVLIGTTLMKAPDIAQRMRELGW